MKNVFFLILVLFILTCNRNKKVTIDTPEKTAEEVATALFGNRYTLEVNNSNTFTIIKTKYKKLKDSFPELDYLVYDHNAEEVIFRDTLKAGYVGWSDEFTVKAIARNLVKDREDSPKRRVYLYNVKKQISIEEPQKIPISSEQPLLKVDENPRFPGCEMEPDLRSKENCSRDKLLTFVYQNLNYPEMAKKNNTSGIAVVRFVVNAKGEVAEAEVLKSVGDGCDEESLRIISQMPIWVPAKNDGKEVPVYYNLAINFRL